MAKEELYVWMDDLQRPPNSVKLMLKKVYMTRSGFVRLYITDKGPRCRNEVRLPLHFVDRLSEIAEIVET